MSDNAHIVLLVEDNHDLRNMTCQLLEAMDYRPIAAVNGKQALEKLRDADELPQVILLDLLMPIMDGWTLLRELQKDEMFAALPVIILSAIADQIESPANVVERLTKPIQKEQLSAALARVA